MLNVTICIDNMEIAETFMDLSTIGTERFGRDFSNYANNAATLVALHFARAYASRANDRNIISKEIYDVLRFQKICLLS